MRGFLKRIYRRLDGWIPGFVLLLTCGLGLWAFLVPLTRPAASAAEGEAAQASAQGELAPLIFLLLLGLCLVAVVANLETRRADSRFVALLGTLLAINAVLRLIPGPLGFSAAFFLPILCGYVFGPGFGFLLGALSLLVSAVLSNGFGPWVPFQMLAAGWTGMIAGWIPDLSRYRRLEIALLATWGLVSGFLFGLLMNLWFWPYLAPGAAGANSWRAGDALTANLLAYGLYYLGTSAWWDIGRAAGNLALIAFAGPPILRQLRRFYRRFRFEIDPPQRPDPGKISRR